jgi:2-polyprenyl-6-methoxyphenol hydroxylase-like FAD-dependent oxidoreductase
MRRLEIAVAGCGPAGLAAATLLARDGHKVRIYDQFDAPRPVGAGLIIQPAGLAVLQKLGLAEEVRATGAQIDRLYGRAAPSERTVLDVRYQWLRREDAHGIGLHRATLFDLLYGAATGAGVAIETGRRIADTEWRAGGRRRLVFAGGAVSAPADLIVDALGSASPLAGGAGRLLAYGALWASLDWCAGFDQNALEQRYVRASRMVGVLPIGRRPGSPGRKAAFFWSLRSDRLAAWRENGLEAWKDEVRALWPATAPLLEQIDEAERMTYARYAHRTLRQPAASGLIHIGDAWHSTSPQLGQGANLAMLDAWAVAKALREEEDIGAALARSVASRRSHVRLYQALSAIFTPAYQSDNRLLPFIRDRLVPPFARIWPATRIQAEMVAGTFGDPLTRLGLG